MACVGRGKGQSIIADIGTGERDAKASILIRRNLDILDTLKTGGFDGARIKFKALFGVESADEAELMRNMGIAVLQQIRPIFGAQPSKEEGFLLKSLEAGLGKSTPGNRRLLTQALKILERSAQVGINAATTAKDFRRAANIQDSLKFDLSGGIDEPPPIQGSVDDRPVTKEFADDIQNLTDEEFIKKYLSGK